MMSFCCLQVKHRKLLRLFRSLFINPEVGDDLDIFFLSIQDSRKISFFSIFSIESQTKLGGGFNFLCSTLPAMAKRLLQRHFAGMEGGSVVSRADLLQQVSKQPEPIPMELPQIPSLFELERHLRASKTRKSMGPDNIPGELLHCAPQHLTLVVWPLYIKQSLTISEAIQYKGGRLISAYKRRGHYKDCNNHRALLVPAALEKHSMILSADVPWPTFDPPQVICKSL